MRNTKHITADGGLLPIVICTVERFKHYILPALCHILGELKLGPKYWVSVLEYITSFINNTPGPELECNADDYIHSLLQAMKGICPRRAILEVLPDA